MIRRYMSDRPDRSLRIVLASASPRRAELLRSAGYSMSVVPSHLEEPMLSASGLSAEEQAEASAFFKARSVTSEGDADLIIGADTVVATDRAVLGKPRDVEDARRILGLLMGTTHSVITGVAILEPATGYRLVQHDRTMVSMRPMSDDELNAYLQSGQWMGKAGAYGIQDSHDRFVERVEGSWSNVVGLPLELLERMIQQWRQAAENERSSTKIGSTAV